MESPGTGTRDDQAGPKEAAAGAGLLFRRDDGKGGAIQRSGTLW